MTAALADTTDGGTWRVMTHRRVSASTLMIAVAGRPACEIRLRSNVAA
jgi:hypothetical protein